MLRNNALFLEKTVAYQGGGKWGHAPWGAPAHFLQAFKNAF